MTRIQQVHWRLSADYLGHPYYVSGHAILNALGQKLPPEECSALRASHGFFVPGEYGVFPEHHSQSGGRTALGRSLPPVKAYADLFLFRDPLQVWLVHSRPRDALNTHPLRAHAEHLGFAPETKLNQPETARSAVRTTTWHISAYLQADRPRLLPLDEDILDGLQFGGKRNYGYGLAELVDSQVVEVGKLDYSQLTTADEYRLDLVTPFVLDSTYPGTARQSVPWWWKEIGDELREREEVIVDAGEEYRLQTVDHGQVVTYCGDNPIETAKNGLRRVGTHSKYGFGELRVRPVESTPSVKTINGENPN